MARRKYELSWTEGAVADLERLPEKVAWAIVAFCETALIENPHRVGKALFAPLDGLMSARRGTYRVIYRIDEAVITVEIVRVRHRSKAYRNR